MTSMEWKVETTRLIVEVINNLPERERTAFVGKHYKGMRLDEIAAAMQLSEEEVSLMLHKAEGRLSKKLKRLQGSFYGTSLAFGRA